MRIHSLVVAFGALAFAAQPALSQDAKLLERGTYLMNSIVACGNCHAQRDKQGRVMPELGLSGGGVFDEKPFKAYAANITPDPETGIGKWTEAQLMRGIREGIRPDGSLIGPPMPIHMYRGISDDDARALVAYLRAQPPVKNVVPKSIFHIKLPRSYGPAIKKTIVAPARSNQVKYGAYLAGPLGHCIDCHTPYNERGHGYATPRRRRCSIHRTVGRIGIKKPDAKGPQGLERCRDRACDSRRQEPRRQSAETADGL